MGCVGSIAAAGIRAAQEQQKKSEAEGRAKEKQDADEAKREEDKKKHHVEEEQNRERLDAEEEQRQVNKKVAAEKSRNVAITEPKTGPSPPPPSNTVANAAPATTAAPTGGRAGRAQALLQKREERVAAELIASKARLANRQEDSTSSDDAESSEEANAKKPAKHFPARLRSENARGVNFRSLPKGPMTDMLRVVRVSTFAQLDDVRAAIKKVEDSDPSDKSCVVNRSIGSADGMTVLQFAISSCLDPEVTKLLMTLGGDSNKLDNYGRNALHHLAIASGRIKDAPTNKFISHIHKVMVELKPKEYEYKGDGSASDRAVHDLALSLCNATKKYKETLIEWDAQDVFMCTPLHYAAENGSSQLLHYLINNCNAKLCLWDSRLRFPHEIAKNKSTKDTILRAIAEKPSYWWGEVSGFELHKAALDEGVLDHDNRISLTKSTMDALDKYRTAYKIKHSIDEVTPNGHTALHCAAARNSIPCAKYFIKHNANPHIRDNYGQLPIDLSASPEMTALIQEAMNNTPANP